MSTPSVDPKHFAQAVTELGRLHSVVTTQAIFNAKGIKLVEQGVAVHPGLYERLTQHQLSVPLEESVASASPMTGREIRNDAEAIVRTTPFFARLLEDGGVRDILLDALEQIPLPAPIAVQLTTAREVRPPLYRHLVCTALAAAWLALDPHPSRLGLRGAAAAGLLHDLGMLHLDPQLLEYKGSLDRAQRRQLYSHPLVSTLLIERHPEYPNEVVQAVMEHHEFLDGSGYPRHLVGDQISRIGKILGLAELIVGALTPGREVPELRLSILLRMNLHRYDEALSGKILRMLRPQSDTGNTLSLLADPVGCLCAIENVLVEWPARLAEDPGLPPELRRNLDILTEQMAQLHRTLARVGAASMQLSQLGSEALDRPLQTELTLLAKEAAWQLRTLWRQVRRRWRSVPESSFPSQLGHWLDRADEAVSRATDAHNAGT